MHGENVTSIIRDHISAGGGVITEEKEEEDEDIKVEDVPFLKVKDLREHLKVRGQLMKGKKVRPEGRVFRKGRVSKFTLLEDPTHNRHAKTTTRTKTVGASESAH